MTPDQILYCIETNDGTYYIYEVDFLDSFEKVTTFLKETIEGYKYIVEVKNPLEQFENTIPYKISDIYS